jgi:diadenosine tetraphosphate (Ap4A) HIT family hydrolase
MPVRQADSWLVTDNMYPYKPSKVHRLLILRRHAEHITELREGEWLELFQIAKKETADLNIAGGTLIMRFGETKFTGGSVHHLHAHLVQSDPDSPDYNKAIGLVMRIG